MASRAPRKGSGYKFRQGREPDRRALGARRAVQRPPAVPPGRRRRPRRLPPAGARPARPSAIRALKQAAGALDFTDLLARARDLIKGDAGRSRAPAAEVHAYLRRRVPGHRSDSGRDSAAPRQRRPRQAVHRRRPEAGDLSLSRHRRRHLLAGARRARARAAARAAADDQLPQRAGDPALRQRRLRAGDDRGRDDAARPTTCRCRRFAPRRTTSQPAIVALAGAAAIRPRRLRRVQGVGQGDRRIAAGRRSAPTSRGSPEKSGWTVSREAAPTAPRRACRFSRATSRCCSGASSASARTSRAPTSTRSRRAAFRTCSSAARRFTAARRSKTIRAALAAIEWPDDELSVFATLKGSLFAIDDEHLLEFRHRFGTFHPFRIPKELGGNSGQELALTGEPTAHLMPIADALRLLQQLHRGAQLPAGRRHDRPAARRDARARRLHPPAGRRAGARQRAPRRRARAPA